MQGKARLERAAIYLVLIAGSILMLIPLAWMVLTSLKSFPEVVADPPVWLPEHPQWGNYVQAIVQFQFDRFFWNSVFVTTMTIAGTLVSSCLAAYAFVFLKARFRNLIFAVLLTSLMLPDQVTIIPLFMVFVKLGWVNTFLPLVIPAWLGKNVFAIFLLRQFFRTIPKTYVEAARIDGASELQILWHVILPASVPVLTAITVFTFLWSWNDLFNPLIYLHDERLYTMPVGLLYFISESDAAGGAGGDIVPWHLVMALTTVMIVPVVVVFFFAQKRFIQGVTSTGLKG